MVADLGPLVGRRKGAVAALVGCPYQDSTRLRDREGVHLYFGISIAHVLRFAVHLGLGGQGGFRVGVELALLFHEPWCGGLLSKNEGEDAGGWLLGGVCDDAVLVREDF